ncbi:uncharacterized protein K452DRAFT_315352 [Aplosporella prunicola CBS 121167]|uniref:Rap-GAP domain-containing protein n=1 Tax=Aplosporella prunicola CBS 121167 TaxID=1176127 RepID=A0A6A6BTD7_9PEZI|nr:uncharacterized protein K452DRAFT_315352 [Aplosporella prunicola CBS 121167]KAF2146097.1 hypothetical protein K452DRAFT_315352 [Aplosporella prunicola CBS 121167]
MTSSTPTESVKNAPPESSRKQSSISMLSNAFLNLIGGNKPAPSGAPSTSTNTAPARGKFARRMSASLEQADTTVASDAKKKGKARAAQSGSVPFVVGGPPELDELLEKLADQKSTVAQRINAANGISSILKEYRVTGVWWIWSKTQSALLSRPEPDAHKAAHQLLYSLVQTPLSSFERSCFFSMVADSDSTAIADNRMQLLSSITNGGRNIDALESKIAPLLASTLAKSFDLAAKARKDNRNAKTDEQLPENTRLHRLFRLVVVVLKFNSQHLSDAHTGYLLEQVLKICRQTTKRQDLHDGIAVIDTLITYKELPRGLLQPCFEVLCAVCNQHMKSGNLRDQAEDVVVHLFGSHIAPAATLTFIEVLKGELTFPQQRLNVVRGAVNVLHDFMFGDKAEDLPELPMSLILPALNTLVSAEFARSREQERAAENDRVELKRIRADNQHLEADISNIMWRLLLPEDMENRYSRQLLQGYDWDVYMEIIIKCALGVSDTDMKNETRALTPTDASFLEDDDQENHHPSIPLTAVIRKLFEIRNELDVVQREAAMMTFLRIGRRLPNDVAKGVIGYLKDERFLLPLHAEYFKVWEQVMDVFFADKLRDNDVRIYAVHTLVDVYGYIATILDSKTQVDTATFLLDHIYHESDPAVLKVLMDAAVDIVSSGPEEMVEHIMDLIRDYLWNFIGSLPEPERPPTRASENPMSPSNVITQGLARMFIRTFRYSVWKATKVYDQLIYIARTNNCDMDARISAIKLLTRIRSDADYAIRLNGPPEGESMAAVLCRTSETAAAAEKEKENSSEVTSPVATLDRNLSQDRRSFVGGAQLSQSRRYTTGSNKPRPVPPLWMYPYIDPQDDKPVPFRFSGLPEEPPQAASYVLFTYLEEDESETPQSEEQEVTEEEPEHDGIYSKVIPAGKPGLFSASLWLEVVITIFQKCDEWEVLSYMLVHLGSQLANHSLWRNSKPQIKFLRNVLCDQIRNGTVPEPPAYTSLKKADVAVCYFHILTMLVSYHAYFEKSEQDDIVKSFYLGIGSWDRTSKWCIHALTVCCHEIPDSTTKHLQNVVQKMSQIITQPHIAIHILEFLTHLVRLTNLYVNFREEEYKMVFGVCFRYLQYVRDQQEKAQAPTATRISSGLRNSGTSRDLRESKNIPEQQVSKPQPKSPADDLPQYVHALAYHVITFWFMAIKLDDRGKFVHWIKNRLVIVDRTGRETYEEQAQITIDMLYSRAYTDSDETAPVRGFPGPTDGKVQTTTWVVGAEMLMTLQTAARTGATQIIKRRPSYTSYGVYTPNLSSPPRHQTALLTGLAAEAFYTTNYVGVLPQDIFQGLYAPVSLLKVGAAEDYVQLPEDDATRRAIAGIDRSSTVDGHKIGIIFIGEGQRTEQQVLQNVMGSGDYTQFLEALGEGNWVRLKGSQMNTQGLDREFDTDGTHTICWRDRAVEVVFHVITLMPVNLEHDPYCINKKKHIGNDFVNIVFNNSGYPFDFDMFPSQFNYVYIVITPESRTTFIDTRHNIELDQFYKVQVLTQPGFPEISPASETKLISGKGLPAYVRMLALNASVFCQVWSTREAGEYVSSWRNRLREIKKLWDKHSTTVATPPSSASGNPGISGSMWHRQSIATFNSDGNRSSIMSGSVDMERQVSGGSR